MMKAYQRIFEQTSQGIIGYMHDDVVIYEDDWDVRVMREFKDPAVGMVGFGAGVSVGTPDIYQVPYHFAQIGRGTFLSNLRKAESHGGRFTGARDVACFDGFAIFVRRAILQKCGGWPVGTPVNYWIYDEMISLESLRQGYRNRLVGIDCDHLEGRSPSIIPEDHGAASLWLYERYRDVLPFRAEER
jgi:hypothetical protein